MPPAPCDTPSTDPPRGCAAPRRATPLVPELALGHEVEQPRFEPTKPVPGSPETETVHPRTPRPKSLSRRPPPRRVGPAGLWGARGCRRGAPGCWHHVCPQRSNTAVSCPRTPSGPCAPSAQPFTRPPPPPTGWRAGSLPMPRAMTLGGSVEAPCQLAVHRQSSRLWGAGPGLGVCRGVWLRSRWAQASSCVCLHGDDVTVPGVAGPGESVSWRRVNCSV